MTNIQNQQLDQIEEKLLQNQDKIKKQKMKVTGKSVFELAKIIKNKSTQNQNSDTRENIEDNND